MSDMNDAFWHKGQRNMVGSRCFSLGTLALKTGGSADAKTTTAIGYSLADTGVIYTKAAMATVDLSGLTAVHSNNPNVTKNDDSTNGDVLVRQGSNGLVIATANQVYIILTLDASGNVRGYAGEIVGTSATAKRPELDLSAEAAFGEIHISNASGSNFTVGTTALDTSNVTVTYANLSFIPAD